MEVMGELLLKIGLAVALGGLIGVERELAKKPAGMRTYMLIAFAATLFPLLGIEVIEHFQESVDVHYTVDPMRIMEAIVVGISFLGAGTIWKGETSKSVENLTTAAGILAMAAIGITIAVELYSVAIVLTAAVLAINWLLWYPEQWIHNWAEKN